MSFGLLPKILPRQTSDRRADFERRLIRMEAEIGGKLFGPIPKGHKRQFFCLDEHIWIWHEEWIKDKRRHIVTTRYTVRPDGVTKSQNGQAERWLSAEEASNLQRALLLYQQRVDAQYRHMLKMD